MQRQKERYIYDLESYPNVFSSIFKNERTKERHRFVVFADKENDARSINQIGEMVDFIETRVQWLIGYNNKEFDDLLINNCTSEASRYRKSHPSIVAREIFSIVQQLIPDKRKDKKPPVFYTLGRMTHQWRSLDLIQLFNPVDRVGLKRLAIILRWPWIEDLPYKPGSILRHEQLDKLFSYHDNDIDMTECVKDELSEAINHRIAYTIKYGTDIINSSNSAIGRQIMADMYSKHLGIPFSSFENLSTEYKTLALKDCISPKISVHSRELQRALRITQEAVIDPNLHEQSLSIVRARKAKKTKPQFEVMVRSKYLVHAMKLGGLHSEGPPEIIEESDEYALWDIDVRGYYPRIICNEGLHPAHLDPRFTPIFQEFIVEERDRIKKLEPVLAYMLKIAANAAFGLTDMKGDATNWLKDPRMAKYITISGQLFLFMLIEGLEMYSRSIVVYSNTDGMTVKVPRIEEALFQDICRRWELYTGFTLEFKSYRKMILRDVNNYLIFVNTDDESERIKAKGVYQYENLMAKELKVKGVVYPIISMAVREWYDKDIPIEETIRGSETIYDFVKAENTSTEKFDVILYHSDLNRKDQRMQKNNRWIVTKGNPGEGRMCKISKETGEKTEMQKGFSVTPVNNIDESLPIESYSLNYSFYLNQAQALINLTKPLNKETHVDPFVQGQLAF